MDLVADVFIDVPDEIDISDMRSKGPQPDEQFLPETPGAQSFLSRNASPCLIGLRVSVGSKII